MQRRMDFTSGLGFGKTFSPQNKKIALHGRPEMQILCSTWKNNILEINIKRQWPWGSDYQIYVEGGMGGYGSQYFLLT